MSGLLQETLVEIERHVAGSGWDQRPQLFALARTAELMAREPDFAARLGLDADRMPAEALTPVEQDPLPDGPLDESLAQVGWPSEVAGCALVQEVVMLPPEVEDVMPRHADVIGWASDHPERREARLAVAVLRDGSRACTVRLRGQDEDELLVGPDLAPALADALAATLD
ncbi:MAG: PPA1309 family protein [Mycobacteriales bacterium]